MDPNPGGFEESFYTGAVQNLVCANPTCDLSFKLVPNIYNKNRVKTSYLMTSRSNVSLTGLRRFACMED